MARKKARRFAKRLDERRTAAHRKWAERHPRLAREERAFRLAQAAIADQGNYRAGTPETIDKAARVQQGALARLFMTGSISADQLAWSAEIRLVHDRIAGDVRIGTVSLETRVDQSRFGDGTFFERLGAVRAEVAYGKWRAALPAPGPVLAMIVEDLGTNEAAARFRKDKRTVGRLLGDALDLWPHYQREACDEVDDATLLAAQAAIL